jgi:hypothetical protein
MDDFTKYEAMRDRGADRQEVYLAGKASGLDSITLTRLLRKVYGLSLAEAKDVQIRADGLAASLDAFQEGLVPAVEKMLGNEQERNGTTGAGNAAPTRNAT